MPVPGSEQDWVYDHVAALRLTLQDGDSLGARIVLLDAVGHVQAVGLGELLASQGREATVVCPLPPPRFQALVKGTVVPVCQCWSSPMLYCVVVPDRLLDESCSVKGTACQDVPALSTVTGCEASIITVQPLALSVLPRLSTDR